MTNENEIIQKQNDQFRNRIMVPVFGVQAIQGKHVYTRGIVDLGAEAQIIIAAKVRDFNDFCGANDPYGEHDFGTFDYEGQKIFWKIDYYDTEFYFGSSDPAQPPFKSRKHLYRRFEPASLVAAVLY